MSPGSERAELHRRWYEDGFFGPENMGDHFRSGAESFPNATMHFVGGPAPRSITLGEMYRQSRSLAVGLRRLGIGPGDAVAIWVPNWLEGALTYQAALGLGATVVPIIHIYGPTEVGFILRDSHAKVLVMPDRWNTIDYRERFDAIADIPALEHVVSIGDDGPTGAVAWSRLAACDDAHLDIVNTDPDDVCLQIYTSGTTANPKGVRHTANTLAAEVRSTAAALGDRGNVNLAAFPAGHIAGVLSLLRMAVLGAGSVVLDHWDADLAARLVAEHGINATAGAPFYLSTLLDAAETHGNDISSLTHYMVGATSVPASLVERADAAGIPVYRAYGSTEHPVITTGTPADPLFQRSTTDGRVTPGNEIRLLDDDDREVGPGHDGEIVSRGPELFVGYSNPGLDAASFLPGGWFRTGDIGRIDDDGYLTITDRKKDVIIRGGENLASKEIEDILSRHPAVVEAAAVGLPDPRLGERVAVYVQPVPGHTIDLDEIGRHFGSAGVARQKTPEHLVLIDELPRSLSGKVRKGELRQRLRSETPR